MDPTAHCLTLAARGLLLGATACATGWPSASSHPPPRSTEGGDETGTSAELPQVRCDAGSHALRASCSWTDLDADVDLLLDDGLRSRLVPLGAGSGELLLADLSPETTYRWEVATEPRVGGDFTTPPLPAGAQLEVSVEGALSPPLLGMITPCAYDSIYVVLDLQGALDVSGPANTPITASVVAYEDVGAYQSGVLEGVSFSEDGTVLAVSGFPGGVAELDREGRLVRAWTEDGLYGAPHHDVFRRDGLTFVLVQELAEGVLLDAVEVFDASGAEVALWRLADHLDPLPDLHGALDDDYSHANSIWVDDAGDWYLSARHLSAVFKIAGLDAPDAGAIRWILVGDPEEVRVEGTLQLLGEESFVRQHNVHITPQGHLALFDNRRAYPDPSRALWLDVDEEAGTASVVQAWTLPMHCPFQGGVWSTAAGTALATCAPWQVAFELAPDQPEPVASVQVRCAGDEGQSYVPRMVPLEAW